MWTDVRRKKRLHFLALTQPQKVFLVHERRSSVLAFSNLAHFISSAINTAGQTFLGSRYFLCVCVCQSHKSIHCLRIIVNLQSQNESCGQIDGWNLSLSRSVRAFKQNISHWIFVQRNCCNLCRPQFPLRSEIRGELHFKCLDSVQFSESGLQSTN